MAFSPTVWCSFRDYCIPAPLGQFFLGKPIQKYQTRSHFQAPESPRSRQHVRGSGVSWKQRGQSVAAVRDAPLGSVKPCVTTATQICKPWLSHLLYCTVLTPRPTQELRPCTVSLPLQDGTHTFTYIQVYTHMVQLFTVNTAVKWAPESPKMTN